MKNYITFLFLGILIITSCKFKDESYYKNSYLKNKSDFRNAKNRLENLLRTDTLLFKIMIEFTGKRIVNYQYIKDTSIHFYTHGNLTEDDKTFFDNMMYKCNLLYIEAYRDSIKYTFSGRNKDIIANYFLRIEPIEGHLIDTNTYLIFESK